VFPCRFPTLTDGSRGLFTARADTHCNPNIRSCAVVEQKAPLSRYFIFADLFDKGPFASPHGQEAGFREATVRLRNGRWIDAERLGEFSDRRHRVSRSHPTRRHEPTHPVLDLPPDWNCGSGFDIEVAMETLLCH
jgi:hypothetical protein